jgi:hypothetical protein
MATIPLYTVQKIIIVQCIRSYIQYTILSESSVATDSIDRFCQ